MFAPVVFAAVMFGPWITPPAEINFISQHVHIRVTAFDHKTRIECPRGAIKFDSGARLRRFIDKGRHEYRRKQKDHGPW